LLLLVSKRRLCAAALLGLAALLLARLAPAAAPSASGHPQVIRRVPTAARVVALTFDDGPDPGYTPAILTLLERYHARATFFVLGQEAVRHPGLLRRITAQGSEIGLHGFSHRAFTALSGSLLARELSRSRQAVQRATGTVPALVRPPYGKVDGKVLAELAALGYRAVLWSTDTRDWRRPGSRAIARAAVRDLSPGEILLFHDGGGDRSQTLQALSVLLPDLAERGYRCLTVSQMLRRGG
jgi:peptidoglycan/xylan/chitin deacetylase (PgdA/CDA1 family)